MVGPLKVALYLTPHLILMLKLMNNPRNQCRLKTPTVPLFLGYVFFGGEWFVIPGYSCPMLSIPILFLLFIVFPCQVSTSQ